MVFVDTNYFLRFLLDEPDRQHQEAVKLFRKGASGEIELFTSTIVIFEIYWVLYSFYGKEKKAVKEILGDILEMDFVKLEERVVLNRALDYLEELKYDFEDAYNLALALGKEVQDFRTFDKKLEKKFKTERPKLKPRT